MRLHYRALCALFVWSSWNPTATALPSHEIDRRQLPDPECAHGPHGRGCWSKGFSIASDFDQKWPITGKTVTYNLEITNGTCNPDGYGSRICLLINGQYRGPTIRATWGDRLVVNVQNNMQDNGTAIHWHGVRQYQSPGMDGTAGLSQCPIAPGTSGTYDFLVTQFGTSWYHSHWSSQYGDGIWGSLIFDGPSTANYDVDLGAYPLNEWYYQTTYQIEDITDNNLQTEGRPPPADNMLINGTNKNAEGGGKYSQTTMQSSKKYRLRLVAVGVDNYLYASLDSHVFEVISADFVPVKPFAAEWLLISPGQRYDVIITANQKPGNYWFRTEVATSCGSENNFHGRAIFTYSNVDDNEDPQSTPFPEPTGCNEPSNLSPFWYQPVPIGSFQSSLRELTVDFNKAQIVPGGDAVVVWALNASSIDVDWENPTLFYVMNGDTNYPTDLNIIPTVNQGGWNYWLIQQLPFPPIPHPIHLHGHDFYVLGQGEGTYNNDAMLNFQTPTRRDTASVPGSGWLALAFQSNNPGAWLMHCHIAWHISEGLGVQFLEAPSLINLPDRSTYDAQCSSWDNYYEHSYYKKTDSGL